ncbi:MAG: ABC transporter permease [Gammaproteobacteria bacterium]|nr:ABC transporter permease [Gammaproteobacteria bacterium]
MRLRRFIAVLRARNYEFFRDRAAWGWSVLFPVLVVMGFAYAFSGDSLELYKVGVHGGKSTGHKAAFFKVRYIQFIPVEELDEAITKVERHQLDMLFDMTRGWYWVNDSSPRGYILERVLAGGGEGRFLRQSVSGEQIRYVDWVIPGVMGMNMMFSALFGVGYVIVRYRKNGVLKRLRATPLSAFEFLTAQVISRLWLIVSIVILVYLCTDLVVDFRMYGSYIDLLLVLILGALTLISLGLTIAARISNEELANGLLNLISWPMLFLSGVWFSIEGLHPYIQKFALILPLTHVTEAARAIMIDGAGLMAISDHLLTLMAMTALFLAIGSYTFRWE